MTRKTSFSDFWRSRKERAACLQNAKTLRLSHSQLKQLQDDNTVRAELKSCRNVSLLPPVGTDFLRRFTSASQAQMNQREEEEKWKDQKVKKKGFPKPTKDLEEGKPLPFIFGEPSPEHLNTPLEELDPYYQSEKTFVVLGKGKVIHRFNAHKACYILGPLNPLRTLAIKILTNSLFSSLIFATILINYSFVLRKHEVFPGSRNLQFVFIAIYMLEVIIKIASRGFCIGKFTFLRNPWNWLDVTLISAICISVFVYFPQLTTLCLILKIFPLFHGLKKIFSSFTHAVKRLSGIIFLTMFMLCILATIGLQSFMGTLRQKCIIMDFRDYNLSSDELFIPAYANDSAYFNFHEHINNPENIYILPGMMDPMVCGNSSDAGICPDGFRCIRAGKNPNYSYTNYDTFGWSLLSSFRLLSQDFWENLMQLVLRSMGTSVGLYFMLFFSPGCFVLVSLIIAAMAAALCEVEQLTLAEASQKEKEFNQIVKVLKKREEEEVVSKTGKSEGQDDGSKKSQEQQQTGKEEGGPQASCSPCCAATTELLLKWNCCGCWRWLKQRLHTIVTNPFFDVVIVICIIIDILFISMEHYPMTEEFMIILSTAHLFFISVYTVEMIIKIIAMDPYNYFKEKWNIFESIIVIVSLVELFLAEIEGLSTLRILRLLRFFRLARWWYWFHVFLHISLKYSLVLLIVFFGFVAVGYQLFHEDYVASVCKISKDCLVPRWHMTTVFHAFLTVFRIFSGSWIETLWDCMEVSSPALCMTFIISAVVIGKLLILHLFLMLLLKSFTGDLAPEERKKNSVEIVFGWCKTWILEHICRCLGSKDKNKSDKTAVNGQEKTREDYVALNMVTSPQLQSDETKVKSVDEERLKRDNEQKDSEVQQDQADEDQKGDTPEKCCCQKCYSCCPFLNADTSQGTGKLCFNCRKVCLTIVQNKYFKVFINIIILLSSTALVFEDIYLQHRNILSMVLSIAELVFALLFLIEMLLKWIGFGFRKYFTNAWCWLEFLIVDVFLLSLMFADGYLGTLRILRVVRILSFFHGPRLVLRTLFHMIPSLFGGILVILFVWLFFVIIGINIFAGKFYFCINTTSTELFHHYDVANKTECFELIMNNYTEVSWENTPFNYDNVMMGYLSLMILGFSNSWYDIAYSGVDSTLVEAQPAYESDMYLWLYFLLFMITVFFSLNFFINIILSDLQRKFGDKHIFMTDYQQKYSKVLMKLFPKSPQRAVPRPQNKCQASIFDLVNSSCYEVVMVGLICLNVVLLMLETMDTSYLMEEALFWMHFIFIIIFLIECIFKIIGFRQQYFKDGWNITDFVILIFQIIGLFLADIMYKYFFPPTVFVCLRLFRLTRILHVIPWTRRIRKLLLAFVKAVPALFNITFVLFVTMVIFSLIGMFNFAYVKKQAMIDDVFNFETFWSSMICMFMTSTTTAWGGLLLPILNKPPACDPWAEHPGTDVIGDCSSPILGLVFFFTYLLFSFLLLIQLFITVVLEIINSEDSEGLCDNDLQAFCNTWKRFDPEDTQLIPYSKLSEFSDGLQEPLRIPKPNATRLVHMDLPLYPGDNVHRTDVLLSLAKLVLDDAEEIEILKGRMEKQFKAKQVSDEPISSTLKRKQEEIAAKVIQRAFRKGQDTQEKEKSVAEVSVSSPLGDASE